MFLIDKFWCFECENGLLENGLMFESWSYLELFYLYIRCLIWEDLKIGVVNYSIIGGFFVVWFFIGWCFRVVGRI